MIINGMFYWDLFCETCRASFSKNVGIWDDRLNNLGGTWDDHSWMCVGVGKRK